MAQNPVLESTWPIVRYPRFVFINSGKVKELAERLATEDLPVPEWREDFFPKDDETAKEFIVLFNSLNFCFANPYDERKFTVDFHDQKFRGSSALAACLMRALEEEDPLLHGYYLRGCAFSTAKLIFRGEIPLPLVPRRYEILRECGKSLVENYGGRFLNVIEDSKGRLFNDGAGLAEMLCRDFPSFEDSSVFEGKTVHFNKRAQLAGGMLQGRFRLFSDADELTVFADYVVPKTLRHEGILEYEPGLAKRVDDGVMIERHCREELEIRASTIHACDELVGRINELRAGNPRAKSNETGEHWPIDRINALNLDYRLWSMGRGLPGRHHYTVTKDY